MADGCVPTPLRAYAFPYNDNTESDVGEALLELADVLEVVEELVGSGKLDEDNDTLRSATAALCFRAQRRARAAADLERANRAGTTRKEALHGS